MTSRKERFTKGTFLKAFFSFCPWQYFFLRLFPKNPFFAPTSNPAIPNKQRQKFEQELGGKFPKDRGWGLEWLLGKRGSRKVLLLSARVFVTVLLSQALWKERVSWKVLSWKPFFNLSEFPRKCLCRALSQNPIFASTFNPVIPNKQRQSSNKSLTRSSWQIEVKVWYDFYERESFTKGTFLKALLSDSVFFEKGNNMTWK